MDKNTELKIDLVYCWVDGNDIEWQKKKTQYYTKQEEQQSNNDCRFIDNEELKYSLRSVEKYAPWINHIYIITDNQIPKWLNTDNPKVTIIDHKNIIPNDFLPTFNSSAIELCMHKIPDLSEYFLYANDDTYIVDYITPEFFYNKAGKPYCRLKRNIDKEAETQYIKTIKNSYELIVKKGYKVPHFVPHHNIDAYKKSVIEEFHKEFEDEINKTIKNKFRTTEDLQRVIYLYYAIAKEQGIFLKVPKCSMLMPIYKRMICQITKKYNQDSAFINGDTSCIKERLKIFHPKLLCINDSEKTMETDRINTKQFLEEYFPQKSSFEKKAENEKE